MGKRAAAGIGALLLLLGLCLLLLLVAIGDDSEGFTSTPDEPETPTRVHDPEAFESSADDPRPATDRPRRKGDGRISGRLLAQNDRSPVGAQVVRLFVPGEAPRETTTDDRGVFSFEGLPRRVALRIEIDAPRVGYLSLPGLQLRRRRARDLGDLLLAPSARVTVHVASSRGEPLSGALVRAFHLGRNATPFSAQVVPTAVATARTNAEGAAPFPQLSVGLWNFVVTANGHARRATGSWELQAGADERQFHVTLDSAATLSGVVRHPDGRAAAGIHVLAMRRTLLDTPENAPLVSRARTGSDGRYALGDLPAGDLVLWTARGDEPRAVAGVVRLPGVKTFDITLPRGCVLRGTVSDGSTGAFVEGVDVEATLRLANGLQQTAHAVSVAGGDFELSFPGTGELLALSARKGPLFLPAGSRPTGLRLFDADAHELHLELVRGATIEGVVRADGSPLPGARVEGHSAGNTVDDVTDGNGVYRLEGLTPGAVSLVATCDGFAPAVAESSIDALRDVRAGQTLVFDLGLTRGSPVAGTVMTPDGKPVGGAEVFVEGDADGWRATTTADGRFELPAARPGATLQLRARATGWGPGIGSVRVAASGPTKGARVTMRPLTRVRGRVLSSTGEPLENAYVQVAGHGGGQVDPISLEWAWLAFERWSVKPDGTFEHEAPIADSGFVVHASAAGHAAASSARVALVSGRTDYDVEIVLEPGAGFSGRVVDPSGSAVRGASIRLVPVRPGTTSTSWRYPGAAGPAIAAVTGQNGAFDLAHQPKGTIGVEVTHPRYRTTRHVVDLPASGETFTVHPILDVTGRAFDTAGRPAAGGGLRFLNGQGTEVARAVCDATGRFRVTLPTTGRFRVSLSSSADSEDALPCGQVEAGTTGVILEARRE